MLGCFKFVYKVPNWIALNWTMRAKPRLAIPNRHVRSVLLWDVTQRRVVVYHWCSGITYQPHLQSQDIQNTEEGTNEVNRQSFFFLFLFFLSFFYYFVHHLILYRCTTSQTLALFPFSGKEAPNLVYLVLFSTTAHHRHSNSPTYASNRNLVHRQ